MVEVKPNEIADLKTACVSLRRDINVHRQSHQRKLARLKNIVDQVYMKIKDSLATYPRHPRRKHRQAVEEFQHSYELLALQILALIEQMSQNQKHNELRRHPVGSNWEAWEDYQADLEDILGDTRRQAIVEYRASLIAILEILDSFERIYQYHLPQGASNNNALSTYLKDLDEASHACHTQLLMALRRRQVKPIELNPGDYPPIETTRLISRSDRMASDHFIIDSIVTRGYTYKTSILRKAAVTIKSQPQE